MTANEFYQIIKDYAKKEMYDQAKKAYDEKDFAKSNMHTGASNEAAKFYQMIEMTWIDNSDKEI